MMYAGVMDARGAQGGVRVGAWTVSTQDVMSVCLAQW